MLGRKIQIRRSGEFVPSARPPECGCSEADVDIDLVDAGLRPAVTAAAMPRAVADDRIANLGRKKQRHSPAGGSLCELSPAN